MGALVADHQGLLGAVLRAPSRRTQLVSRDDPGVLGVGPRSGRRCAAAIIATAAQPVPPGQALTAGGWPTRRLRLRRLLPGRRCQAPRCKCPTALFASVHDGAGQVVDVKVLDDAAFCTQRRAFAGGESLVERLFG